MSFGTVYFADKHLLISNEAQESVQKVFVLFKSYHSGRTVFLPMGGDLPLKGNIGRNDPLLVQR